MTKMSVPRPVRQFLAAESAIGAATTAGAHVPATVPAMGKAICSYVCAKLSSFWGWYFCASAAVTVVVGVVAFLVIGEAVLQMRAAIV